MLGRKLVPIEPFNLLFDFPLEKDLMKRIALSMVAIVATCTPCLLATPITVNFTSPNRAATIIPGGVADTAFQNVLATGAGGTKAFENRPLLSFDTSSLTSGPNPYVSGTSQVTSMTLTMKTTGGNWNGTTTDPTGSDGFDLQLYAIDTANADWALNSGRPTWNNRKTGTSPWINGGNPGVGPNVALASLGASLASDFEQDLSGGTVTLTSTDSATLTALIDAWVSGGNAGFFVAISNYGSIPVNSSLLFDLTNGNKPALSITYAVPEPGTFAMLLFGSVMFWVLGRKRR
jgi:hypothetical protein